MKPSKSELDLAGYFSESQYPSVLGTTFTPNHVAGALQWQGFSPAPIRESFTHLDIGCGDGVGLSVMAAAFPQARFIGVDAMPGHIETGRAFAKHHGIGNVEFVCQTFEQFYQSPESNIDAFDYITCQGVIAWVSETNRQRVFDIVARSLSDKGAFTVGYNTLPGWHDKLSLQRLLLQFLGSQKDKSKQAVTEQIEFLEALSKAGAKTLPSHVIDIFKRKVAELPHDYVLHEYLNGAWQPLWFAQVCTEMQNRDLYFATSANNDLLREDFSLRRMQRETIKEIKDTIKRQTAIDVLLNTQFRVDIFSREKATTELEKTRGEVWLVATKTLEEADFSCLTTAGRLKFDNPAARDVLTQLENGPRSLAAICRYSPHSYSDTVNAIETLLVARGVVFVGPTLDDNPAPHLNQYLTQYASVNNQNFINSLVSRCGIVPADHSTVQALGDNPQSPKHLFRLGL